MTHTIWKCLWYSWETGYIGKANHVCFDKVMNDLPSNLIPPNQHDLEHVEQGDKFPFKPINPVKPNKVDVDKEFKYFVYLFSKI